MTYILTDVLDKVKSWFMSETVSTIQPSPYLIAIKRLRDMKSPGRQVYASIDRIHSLYKTIDEYVDALEAAIDSIQSGRVYSFGSSTASVAEVPLRKWYLSRRGDFIDPDAWFSRFIDKACVLLELFELMESEPADSVAMERSRTRLVLLINNIIDISTMQH